VKKFEYISSFFVVVVEQFLTGKDEHEKDDGNKTALERLKDSNKGVVKCRYQFHFNY
jgi:hypothetical protein